MVAIGKDPGSDGTIGLAAEDRVSSFDGKKVVHGFSVPGFIEGHPSLDISLSDLSCLCLVGTKDLSVSDGEVRPLDIGAVGIEGVGLCSWSGLVNLDPLSLGIVEGVQGVRVAFFGLRGEPSSWEGYSVSVAEYGVSGMR